MAQSTTDSADVPHESLRTSVAPLPQPRRTTHSLDLRGGLALGGLAVLLAGLYWNGVQQLTRTWDLDPNYSHGWFIPFVSLAFAYGAWQRVGWPLRENVPTRSVVLGGIEIVFGLGLQFVAWFPGPLLFGVLALVCIVRGLLLVLGGREVTQAYGFSVLFLIFMAPLPMSWYQPLALAMQNLVSVISTAVLAACGIPVFREGYIINMPGYVMEVGAACSGLRQLTAFVALGVIVAHVFGRTTWYKWTVSLMGVPVAIATNCLRVVVTGFILKFAGPKWAEGVFHTIEGLVTLVVGTLLMVSLALLLGNWDDPQPTSKPGETDQTVSPMGAPAA